jgi:hypothetical protein
MLALFKGELSYNDIMRTMVYKDMIALRDARVNQIMKERDEQEKAARNAKAGNNQNGLNINQ